MAKDPTRPAGGSQKAGRGGAKIDGTGALPSLPPEAAQRIAALVQSAGAPKAANDDAAAGGRAFGRKPGRVSASDRPASSSLPTDELLPRTPRMGGFDVEAMNREWGLVLMGSKTVVLREQLSGPLEDRQRIITVDAFRTLFLNSYTEVATGDGKVNGTTWAKRWLAHRSRRTFYGIEFFPNPDGAESTPGYLNLWQGFSVEPRQKEGGWSILRDHLFNNVCNSDEALFRWVFGWFAHMVQRPRERVGTALVMRGKMGTGKTKVGEVMGSLFKSHYFAVDDPRYVTGQFNAHMASCLLLQAEEAVWAGDKAAEGRLKGLVTSRFQMIEAKGIDPIRLDNFVRLLMTSNEDWVVPAGKDERRFCVLDVNPRCAQNHEYFAEMDAQLDNGGREALLYDLMTFNLAGLNLRQIPSTSALFEQKMRSLAGEEAWWHECLESGRTPGAADTWMPEVSRDAVYQHYRAFSEGIGIGRRRTPDELGRALHKMVPGLGVRRVRITAEGEQRRPRCYVFPPLEECRANFSELLGWEIAWGDGDGG